MVDEGYVFSKDNSRVFLNTSLGCSGRCCYCYLSKMGYSNSGNDIKTVSADYVLNILQNSNLKITSSTLITLGCFSECWDENNKPETIKLIKHFLQKGNQIQLSTKRKISLNELTDIIPLIKYYGQLVVFVSCATISKQSYIESNTTEIEGRFKTFKELQDHIPTVLYIKPVLKNITIKDVELFKSYIELYNIKDVVVGSIFTNESSLETVHFSNKENLFYNEIDDEKEIIKALSPATEVYKRSTEVVKKYYKTIINNVNFN